MYHETTGQLELLLKTSLRLLNHHLGYPALQLFINVPLPSMSREVLPTVVPWVINFLILLRAVAKGVFRSLFPQFWFWRPLPFLHYFCSPRLVRQALTHNAKIKPFCLSTGVIFTLATPVIATDEGKPASQAWSKVNTHNSERMSIIFVQPIFWI